MLTYKQSNQLEVMGFSNLDFAECVDTRKSASGYIFLFAEGTVSWSSTKQKTVAAFTMGVEYVTYNMAFS